MEFVMRKPMKSDFKSLEKLLKSLEKDFVPAFSKDEREDILMDYCAEDYSGVLLLTKSNFSAGYTQWYTCQKDKKYAFISFVGVHPKYRGRGIATILMEETFNQIIAQGFIGVYYNTWHANTPMIELSKKLGVRIIKIYSDEDYRGKGGKSVLFKKNFN
jgi:ribosomal protein S18 acetylase RimI-like enzyme